MREGEHMELHIKLKEVLTDRGITQKQLVEMTGLRPAAVSEIVNNQRQSISKDHIVKICEALEIDKIEDILEFRK